MRWRAYSVVQSSRGICNFENSELLPPTWWERNFLFCLFALTNILSANTKERKESSKTLNPEEPYFISNLLWWLCVKYINYLHPHFPHTKQLLQLAFKKQQYNLRHESNVTLSKIFLSSAQYFLTHLFPRIMFQINLMLWLLLQRKYPKAGFAKQSKYPLACLWKEYFLWFVFFATLVCWKILSCGTNGWGG